VLAKLNMASGLFCGQARLRKLGRVSTLQRDRVWKSLTHRRGRVGLRSDSLGRRRVAFDDEVVGVCLFLLGGLVVLSSVMMLLSWATATLPPPRMLKSCPEFELCAAPTADGSEPLWADDPRNEGLRMSR
jgi:hypothetical protein